SEGSDTGTADRQTLPVCRQAESDQSVRSTGRRQHRQRSLQPCQAPSGSSAVASGPSQARPPRSSQATGWEAARWCTEWSGQLVASSVVHLAPGNVRCRQDQVAAEQERYRDVSVTAELNRDRLSP